RVPQANRIGKENDGWTVAKYLLEFERGGSAYAAMVEASLAKLRDIADAEPAGGGVLSGDPAFALKLAAAAIKQQAAEYTEHRTIAEIVQRGRPGPASSIMKVLGSETNQWMTELMVEAVQYYGAAYQPEARVPGNNIEPIGPAHAVPVVPKFLNFRASSIYGGSNEIQRNIVAKQVLGL
ncbi:MAG: acyl-CoA dehydrogenase family protein, partial [Alphaproteobacteria bacterium]|nr:acyl-CoA dehydrogenase family protein [Alphaproteobacteria bacterium]